MNFGSHTDSVVIVAAELVNAVTAGSRQGRAYSVPADTELAEKVHAALSAGSRQPGDLLPKSRLMAFCQLGQQIRPVFQAVSDDRLDAAATAVNGLLEQYRPSPYLDRHDDEPWHLHFHGDPAGDPSGWGGGISVGLATVLGSEHADRLGVCHAPSCDRVYVDVSKNGTRRFCSTSCQNRVKAAAHRARAAAG